MYFTTFFKKIASKKNSLGFLLMFIFSVAIFSCGAAVAYADVTLLDGESFTFETPRGANPSEVEYTGEMTGYPRSNSGANYFHKANYTTIIPTDYRVKVSGPQTNAFEIDGGFAWNDNFGWISFMCDGGENLGLGCSGDYRTQINNIALDPSGDYVGQLSGNAWNESIGYIDFSWRCISPICEYVEVNLTDGTFGGYAENDAIGWMYFEGTFQAPNLTGTCGNGVLEEVFGEQCDDGNNDDNDGCNASCQDEFCGDGVKQPSEECDAGGENGAGECSVTCEDIIPGAVCGNGSAETGEECDGEPDCSPDCKWNACGDDFLYPPEECEISDPNCDVDCTEIPPAAICGNGSLESNGADGIPSTSDDEICDDGNSLNTDTCTNWCSEAECQDGFLQPFGADGAPGGGDNEDCDDGNNKNGDGCDRFCNWEFVEPPPPICPNGIAEIGEECDDGNLNPNDGCDQFCNSVGICGNDNLERGEDCDDGNLFSGDGCDALCNDEDSIATCGNGIKEINSIYGGDEECDDGAQENGDGCDKSCKVELEWCGDGITNGSEECDDADEVDNDVCKNNCTFGVYSVCGDGEKTRNEDCEDGNTLSGDGCDRFCNVELPPDPDDDDDDDDDPLPPPPPPECDNCVAIDDCEDFVEFFEEVLDMDLGSAEICNEYCGNGDQEEGEECDDGNLVDGDGCSASCEDEIAGSVCGNDIQEGDEGCDDGNNESGDGCSAYCEDEGTIIIFEDPTCEEMIEALEVELGMDLDAEAYCYGADPYCGDEEWNGYEECDWSDPYDDLADFCSLTCEIEWAICGDGYWDVGEECDDGNSDDGDGCDSWCEYEYEPGVCGDGLWNLGEECDDGIAEGELGGPPNEDFACDQCELVGNKAECGDGTKDSGEECDDSNLEDGDGCSSACEYEPEPEEITCFPDVYVEPFSLTTYKVYADLDCIEDPNDWDVSIAAGGWEVYDTMNCDQTGVINSDSSTGCDPVSETSVTTNLQMEDDTDDIHIGSVSSHAPTGYSCPNDDENLYVIEDVELLIESPAGELFREVVSVDTNLNFVPRVAPSSLTYDGGYYLDVEYGQPVNFEALVEILVPVKKYGARYTLSVDYPYVFGFDKDGGGIEAPLAAPDSNLHSKWSKSFSYPDYSELGVKEIGVGGHFSTPMYTAYIVNEFEYPVEAITNEALDFIIQYRTAGNKYIYYCADSLPDAEDLLLNDYEVQIEGPVSSDKFRSGGMTKVGSVGEGIARKDIMKNISHLIKTEDLNASGATLTSFDSEDLFDGDGSHLEYVVDDQTVYYFKDDVVIEGNGELVNTENRTLIIDGGNLYVDTSVKNLNDDTHLEIIVLNGNVYVGPNVTIFEANIFADGSMFPYDGETKGDGAPSWQLLLTGDYLDNQFVFKGSLVSENTIGGATDILGPFKGDGSITTLEIDAYIYDMNRFRRHGLIPGLTDDVGNPQNCDGDSSMEIGPNFSDVEGDSICGSDYSTYTSDMVPAGLRHSEQASDANYAVYFIYKPPSKTSAIFKSSSDVNVTGQ